MLARKCDEKISSSTGRNIFSGIPPMDAFPINITIKKLAARYKSILKKYDLRLLKTCTP
jgi:hypothetical protein